jgi:hypothetical protein
MQLDWDDQKNEANRIKHGIDFSILYDFEWENAVIVPDTRRDYGEKRFLAYGLLDERLCALVFTPRNDCIRIIGARKANDRERRMYNEKNK